MRSTVSGAGPDRIPVGNRVGPVLGLFFLAPLAGEFLLGNLPVTMFWLIIVLAPIYGGGALLIREVSRR